MKLIKCCCEWEFVVGKKHVFGPIYAMGIGAFPTAKNEGMRMWTREEFAEMYADCDAHISGNARHKGFCPAEKPMKFALTLPVETPLRACGARHKGFCPAEPLEQKG